MARWKRTRSNGPERITVNVHPDHDPELYEWLMAQPYGAAAKKARAMLLEAVRAGKGDAEPTNRKRQAPVAAESPAPKPREPAPAEPTATAPPPEAPARAAPPPEPEVPETAPEAPSEPAPPQAARKNSPQEGEGTGGEQEQEQEQEQEDIDPETLRIMQESMERY